MLTAARLPGPGLTMPPPHGPAAALGTALLLLLLASESSHSKYRAEPHTPPPPGVGRQGRTPSQHLGARYSRHPGILALDFWAVGVMDPEHPRYTGIMVPGSPDPRRSTHQWVQVDCIPFFLQLCCCGRVRRRSSCGPGSAAPTKSSRRPSRATWNESAWRRCAARRKPGRCSRTTWRR